VHYLETLIKSAERRKATNEIDLLGVLIVKRNNLTKLIKPMSQKFSVAVIIVMMMMMMVMVMMIIIQWVFINVQA